MKTYKNITYQDRVIHIRSHKPLRQLLINKDNRIKESYFPYGRSNNSNICVHKIIQGVFGKNLSNEKTALMNLLNKTLKEVIPTEYKSLMVKYNDMDGIIKMISESKEIINDAFDVLLLKYPDNTNLHDCIKNYKRKIEEQEKEKADLEKKKSVFNERYMKQIIGTYYRGDSRDFDELTDGFKAREQKSIDEARNLIIDWYCNENAETMHQEHISRNNVKCAISTGTTIECAGYGANMDSKGNVKAVRNVYKITIKGLKEIQASKKIFDKEVQGDPQKLPLLVLNSDNIQSATIIGIKSKKGIEVTFFTPIPKDCIEILYKYSKDTTNPSQWLG